MKRIEFVCGIGFAKSGEPLDNVDLRLAECRRWLVAQWGAFTELDGRGHWGGQSEPVKVFVVYADSDVVVARGAACRLAVALNQQCVAVAVSEVNFKLVGGAK
jgi:hypothetical protein